MSQDDQSEDVELGKLYARQGGHKPRRGSVYKRGRRPLNSSIIAVLLSSLAMQATIMYLVVHFYEDLYTRSPYGSAALVSGALSGISQGVVQTIVLRRPNLAKLLKFYVWGIIVGLWTKFWTDQLTSLSHHAVVKIICDQVIGNPFSTFMFISFSGYWDGVNVDNYLNSMYFRTLRSSYIIWPIASTINFFYLPLEYMVPFNACVTLVWNIILGISTS